MHALRKSSYQTVSKRQAVKVVTLNTVWMLNKMVTAFYSNDRSQSFPKLLSDCSNDVKHVRCI